MNCILSFGERLEDLMKEKKINGVTLSDKTGISTTTISDMINGKRENPTAENIIELSKALNVSTDYLLGLSESKFSDIDDRAIHEKTGLSDKAILVLTQWKQAQVYWDESTLKVESKPDYGIRDLQALNSLLDGIYDKAQENDTTADCINSLFSQIGLYLRGNFTSATIFNENKNYNMKNKDIYIQEKNKDFVTSYDVNTVMEAYLITSITDFIRELKRKEAD